jgi:hypothetical protein
MRDNLMRHNTYGVKGDGVGVGEASLLAFASPFVFERNALAGGAASRYPADNLFPTMAEFEASFVDPASGDFTLLPTSPLRTAATDGTPVGADTARVMAAVTGIPIPAPPSPRPGPAPTPVPTPEPEPIDTERQAICRPGVICQASSSQRVR